MLWSITRSSEYLQPGTSEKAFCKKGHDVGGCQLILKDKDGCYSFIHIKKFKPLCLLMWRVEEKKESMEKTLSLDNL